MSTLFDQREFDLHVQAMHERKDGDDMTDAQVEREIERSRRFYRYVICACRAKVYVPDFTNTCNCGRDYNSSGALLAQRSQWGEETGETAADILNAEAAGFPEED